MPYFASYPRLVLLIGVLSSLLSLPVQAQQFGRNKPIYEKFDFKVYQSPEFELYSYIDNPEFIQDFLNDAEEWYRAHQFVLQDTIAARNPFILYANHPDFQQTTAIGGRVGVGTGGVTEAFKNRVIMPVAMSNQQTHHVLGHELVHAFQYNMVINGDSTSLQNLGNLPLWMIEGLAEYLSIGGIDAFTAMWMRDAVLHDDIPTIKELNSGRYFPYRYGQAFWAFVTGLQGDDVINPYFRATAKFGLETATELVLGYSLNDLSKLWQDALRKTYVPHVGDKEERFIGKQLISKDKEGGRINVAPEISPDGRYVIFLSEKNLFSIDLFLANARTGEVIRKVSSSTRASHIDDFNYIESSGTWSPRGDQFAYSAVSKGDNILVINDTESGRTIKEIRIDGVPAFINPAWSPDGRTIVVTGLVEGQHDLYAVDVRTDQVTQLTDDRYSETHASWSVDGSRIWFSTDQLSFELNRRPNGSRGFNLAYLDIVSGRVENLDIFPGADNLNPEEDANGHLLFLSNRDGFRNMYRYDPSTGEVFQMTDLITGISGITHYAPAISVDRKRNRVVYTYFSQQGYEIYQANVAEDFVAVPVDPTVVDFSAASLPRLNPRAPLVVDEVLEQMDQGEVINESDIQLVDYKSKFKLDYAAGGGGVGVGTNNVFGTTAGLAGGVQLLFSDILGRHQFFTSLSLNGEITDFGGSVAYINRANRVNWGASLSRIPYRSVGFVEPFLDTLDLGGGQGFEAVNSPYLIQRLFQNQVGLFAQLPFNTQQRAEVSVSYAAYTNRVDQYDRYFDPRTGFQLQVFTRPERQRDLEQPSFFLGTVGGALVSDNSSFGLTAPLNGHRARLGYDQYFGEFGFGNLTADYRRYLYLGKATLAGRALHYGRYGGEEQYPLYLGSPWFIRGLSSNNIRETFSQNGRSFEELIGTKLAVANLELRIPFTGPERLALIKSGLLFSDLNFFIDAGMAWTSYSQFGEPVFRLDENGEPIIFPGTGQPIVDQAEVRPIATVGASLRVNLFGQIILEPYLARPLVKGGTFNFGLNLLPGW